MYLVLLGFERPVVATPLYRADPSERPLRGQGLACYRARPKVRGSRVALRTGYQAYDLHHRCVVRVRYSPGLGYPGGSRCVVPREKWRWWRVQVAVSAGQAPKV